MTVSTAGKFSGSNNDLCSTGLTLPYKRSASLSKDLLEDIYTSFSSASRLARRPPTNPVPPVINTFIIQIPGMGWFHFVPADFPLPAGHVVCSQYSIKYCLILRYPGKPSRFPEEPSGADSSRKRVQFPEWLDRLYSQGGHHTRQI